MPLVIHYRSIDKGALMRKFVDEDWPKRLAGYPCSETRFGPHKTMKVWYSDDLVKCRKLEYSNPAGGQDVVRQLLDDDGVMW